MTTADAAATSGATAPPLPSVPSSILSSIGAWWSFSQLQAAQAELYLYSQSGYFDGAQLGNASDVTDDGVNALAAAYESVRSHADVEQRWTPPKKNGLYRYTSVGRQCAPDGKVGCVRLVDIGEAPTPASGGGVLRLGGHSTHKKRCINMVEVGTPLPYDEQPKNEEKIVLMHGYGAGSAFFFQNIGAFTTKPNSRFFMLDWLGMGRSSRPPYQLPRRHLTIEERAAAAENFFLEGLEQWREKMRVDKMVLVGHSLGGYLSTAYALRHPERVSRLVLISPVGIPEGSWRDVIERRELHTHDNSKSAHEALDEDASASIMQRASTMDSTSTGENVRPRELSPRFKKFLGWLWDKNVSPFGILRASSFMGPWLMSHYTSRRFGSLENTEMRSLHAYCHGVFMDRGSSEYCRACLLPRGTDLSRGPTRARRLRARADGQPRRAAQDACRLPVWQPRLDGRERRHGRVQEPYRRRKYGRECTRIREVGYVNARSHRSRQATTCTSTTRKDLMH